MLAEYRDFWPLTVRQVYYRLIGLGVKPRTKRGDEAVGDALNRGRRSGRWPWESIRDEGAVRSAVQAKHADDPDFATFAALIAEQGYTARFEGIKYRYLRVDDYLYWLSRSLFTPGQNINRRPAADLEGQPEHEQGTLPV